MFSRIAIALGRLLHVFAVKVRTFSKLGILRPIVLPESELLPQAS